MGGAGDYFCSRYDESFPNLINTDPRLGDPGGRKFTFWACSGAKTAAVTDQVKALDDGSQDVITISSGGNDALLSDILNECVFGWNAHSTPLSSACPPKLDDAQKVIDDPNFHSALDGLLSSAKSKLNKGGKIYYTGYAEFWGEEDNQCDSVTWSFWYNYGKRQYLTLDRRQTMNKLVRNMNSAISDAVKRAGTSVVFVPYDQYYIDTIGRFCEKGYSETDSNRNGLLLYEYYTDDTADADSVTSNGTKLARSGGPVMNGTFEWQINEWIKQAQQNDSSLTPAIPQNPAGPGASVNSVNATPDQLHNGYTTAVLPDSYGRIFHPRPGGHQLIANLVLYNMMVTRAKQLSVPQSGQESQTIDTCPAVQSGGVVTTGRPTASTPGPLTTALSKPPTTDAKSTAVAPLSTN